MGIPISYRYKDFPGNKKLTQKSMRIGSLTGTPGMILCVLPVAALGALIIGPLQDKLDNDVYNVICVLFFIAAMIGVHRLLVKYRERAFQKLTKQYIQELEVLRQTNPDEFMKIKQELEAEAWLQALSHGNS